MGERGEVVAAEYKLLQARHMADGVWQCSDFIEVQQQGLERDELVYVIAEMRDVIVLEVQEFKCMQSAERVWQACDVIVAGDQ